MSAFSYYRKNLRGFSHFFALEFPHFEVFIRFGEIFREKPEFKESFKYRLKKDIL